MQINSKIINLKNTLCKLTKNNSFKNNFWEIFRKFEYIQIVLKQFI